MGAAGLAAVLSAAPLFAQSAAVLPFANPKASPASAAVASSPGDVSQANLDWIGESIAETVRDALGSRGLVTMTRKETDDAYRELNLRGRALLTEASVLKIGEALAAEQVVYGTFEFTPETGLQIGPAPAAIAPAAPEPATIKPADVPAPVRGTLKISARIFDRRKMHLGPEFVETGNLDDLATFEAHLAWRTLELIAPWLAPPESDFRSLRTPIRLDAEESYVRGLLAKSPDQQEKLFLQAARLDARFTHPCLQLGRIHYDRKEYRQAADWLQKIGPDDVHFRDASFLLGLSLYQSGDYAGAQKAFQAVADVVPLSEVFNNLGAAENRRDLPQALDAFRKALEGDPNDPLYLFNLGYALWKKGDFANAAERFRSVLDRQPEDQTATLLLGMCLKKQGPRPGDARLEAALRLKTNYEERAYWQLKALVGTAH